MWVPKYRKKVLVGPVAIRVRDLIRQIAMEHELHRRISGKVARDHVHVLVVLSPASGYQHDRPVVEGDQLKGTPSGVPHLRKKFWGRHFWARGYLAVEYGDNHRRDDRRRTSDEQEGEPVHDDSRFPIDNS